ncbi:hypothetical protein AB1Y20_014429 [Prymnesium parvum]|uniref:holo-[acyl-carrier-protein] synthase n=1 Tax=Prymnesium parvum TaxID=97485 RepID=A0AB34IFU3_PRYPA
MAEPPPTLEPPWPPSPSQLCWSVDLTGWRPGTREWYWLLRLLPPHEQLAIHAAGAEPRAGLASRLLQRRAVARLLSPPPAPPLPYDAVAIGRTRGNKPFALTPRRPASCANLTFNVSHTPAAVLLAADPVLLVGLHLSPPFRQTFAQLREAYDGTLSPREWERLEALPAAARVAAFRVAWAAKTAYVKARGDGMAFPLAEVEVVVGRRGGKAAVAPAGGGVSLARWEGGEMKALPLWRVDVMETGEAEEGEWPLLAVARGPVSDAVDSVGDFVKTFTRPRIPHGEIRARLLTELPPFEELSIADLVPPHMREEYLQITAILDRPFNPPVTRPLRNSSRRPEPQLLAGEGTEFDIPSWIHPKNAGVEEEERRYFCWQIM